MPIAKLMQQKPICSANASLRAGPRRSSIKSRAITGTREKSYRHFWHANQAEAEKPAGTSV